MLRNTAAAVGVALFVPNFISEHGSVLLLLLGLFLIAAAVLDSEREAQQ